MDVLEERLEVLVRSPQDLRRVPTKEAYSVPVIGEEQPGNWREEH